MEWLVRDGSVAGITMPRGARQIMPGSVGAPHSRYRVASPCPPVFMLRPLRGFPIRILAFAHFIPQSRRLRRGFVRGSLGLGRMHTLHSNDQFLQDLEIHRFRKVKIETSSA